ncbi:hypothetical protein F5Y16DRAFT_385076 [Xylariaceae sp. FL0255]|nr:hypothetical protein F5Y16DRAFT_385076 [Xylariaceae sp. FL0255]
MMEKVGARSVSQLRLPILLAISINIYLLNILHLNWDCQKMKQYDPCNGLSYRQSNITPPASRPTRKPWNHQKHVMNFEECLPRRGLGPPSLVVTCTNIAARNLDELEQSYLNVLPSHLIGTIWLAVRRSNQNLSFENWKLFATTLPWGKHTEKYLCRELLSWDCQLGHPQQSLSHCILPLTSCTFDFLTHLVITDTARADTHDLLKLGQLKNLAVFEIMQPYADPEVFDNFPRLTDSIVREWARLPNPFPVLRILRVWGYDFTTFQSTQYLNCFPSLVLYDVAGYPDDWKAAKYRSDSFGWSSYKVKPPTRLNRSRLRDLSRCTNVIMTLACYAHHLQKDTNDERWDMDLETIVKFLHSQVRALSPSDSNINLRMARSEEYEEMLKNALPEWTCSGCEHEPHKCQTSYREDSWGYLLYCHIGGLISNRDLVARGLEIGTHSPSLQSLVLAPRSIAKMVFGSAQSSSKRPRKKHDFEYRRAFIRKGYYDAHVIQPLAVSDVVSSETATTKRVRCPTMEASYRHSKRRVDIESILNSFQ